MQITKFINIQSSQNKKYYILIYRNKCILIFQIIIKSIRYYIFKLHNENNIILFKINYVLFKFKY